MCTVDRWVRLQIAPLDGATMTGNVGVCPAVTGAIDHQWVDGDCAD